MIGYLLTFLAGILLGASALSLWLLLRFLGELKRARVVKASEVFAGAPGEKDLAALAAVGACKNRLRWSRELNPEWLLPLLDEIPRLVREIAEIYHPESPEPLLAPGLSHFTRATELAAADVTQFLQQRTIGRLVDVSAHKALRVWERGRGFVNHRTMQSLGKWYKRALPVWQVLSFKSPLTWASMAVNNVATRTLQPAIVDIVARRAVELYSGRVAASMGDGEVVK
ncbi:hypothetical protein FEM03_21610 [Phragmitibacter flavus]|uniref:Uncharacterized protein n=1 Tax=Phragmitibacter flavus TaxID=2576071 RepID=A0A5R8K8L7_9BACT|nr:hypothetical protein [Phragmitibacter flavus]TLD68641.1 hypothetical protein FEM03_21610 [Phragmitibacter flavus]